MKENEEKGRNPRNPVEIVRKMVEEAGYELNEGLQELHDYLEVEITDIEAEKARSRDRFTPQGVIKDTQPGTKKTRHTNMEPSNLADAAAILYFCKRKMDASADLSECTVTWTRNGETIAYGYYSPNLKDEYDVQAEVSFVGKTIVSDNVSATFEAWDAMCLIFIGRGE